MRLKIKLFLLLVLIPNLCFGALSITNYTTFQDLNCANTANIDNNDIVTGTDTGAVGVVLFIDDNVDITVAVISGDFTAGGDETEITNQDSDTATISSVTTPSDETVPNNVVIVTGQDAGTDSTANTNEAIDTSEVIIDVTDASVFTKGDIIKVSGDSELMLIYSTDTSNSLIACVRGYAGTTAETHNTATDILLIDRDLFRTIRNASNSGGWGIHTDPSATSHYLTLDATVFIGRTDASSETVVFSTNELVTIDDGLRIMGNASYPTSFYTGSKFYNGSNTYAYFDGITLVGDSNGGVGKLVSVANPYGKTFLYDSTFKSTFDISGAGSEVGRCLFDIPIMTIDATSVSLDEFVYFGDIGLVPSSGGITWSNCYVASNDWQIFPIGTFESTIDDIQIRYAADVIGALFADVMLHFIDSKVDLNQTFFQLYSSVRAFDEKTFNLTVKDVAGNAIQSANVRLLDKNNYCALYSYSGSYLEENLTNSETDVDVTDGTDFTVGDMIRIDTEKMLVTNISTNTLTVTRGQEGTTAVAITAGSGAGQRKVYVCDNTIQTDANGQITEYNIVRYMNRQNVDLVNYNPFTLVVSKDGYADIKQFVYFGSASSAQSYKTDKVNMQVKLMHSVSAGRDAMGDEFR